MAPPDRCLLKKEGGARLIEKFRIKRESVKSFIEKLKGVESHYCRGRSSRQYLSCKLNISKLWKIDNSSVNESLKNIGIGRPVTDAYSKCIEQREKIKVEQNQVHEVELMTQLRVHKLRDKAFYAKLREENDNMVAFSFDCQKNLDNCKVPD
ncbi:hypothetical protein J6590_091096 [Homalodisca vitripennis]|nr:hypothetical protein J6590_091096 [Homalodisca vitripennis]